MKVRTALLVASFIIAYFLGIGATYLLNAFGIVKVPLSYVNFFGSWILPFGVYAVLNFVYNFGFSDRKRKYIFFSGLETPLAQKSSASEKTSYDPLLGD